MQIESDDLKRAAASGLITQDQAQHLWTFWQKNREDAPRFHFSHVLYYFGGFLAIFAVTLFVTQAWDDLQGYRLFLFSLLLVALGASLSKYFLNKNLPIPAGIMSTFALVLVPLAVYNLQVWIGFLPERNLHYSNYTNLVSWYWVPMELTTLFVGALMFFFSRFPFLLFPIAVTLWYLSMDLVALLFHRNDFYWRAEFSVYFGFVMLLLSVYIDLKNSDDSKDNAFWLYIFGVLTFWLGLSCLGWNNELHNFFYLLINIAMIGISVFLDRRVFAVFGALGVLVYLSHLSLRIFPHSLGFPVVLVFLGVIIIFAATRWPRVRAKLIDSFHAYIPKKILNRIRY